MNVLRETTGEKLKKGWVIQIKSLKNQYRTSLFKIVKVSEFGAALLPFNTVVNKKFKSREEEDMYYSKSKLIFISNVASVKVIGIHRAKSY